MTERENAEQQIRRLYEQAESQTARAMEELVSRPAFGELLGRVTENAVAVTKIWGDVGDLVLRNLRLAGRSDVTRLARQLNRSEDKLEQILQELEQLHDERRLGAAREQARANGAATAARTPPRATTKKATS